MARKERWFQVLEDDDGTLRVVTTGRITLHEHRGVAYVSIPLRAARILRESGGVLVVKIVH